MQRIIGVNEQKLKSDNLSAMTICNKPANYIKVNNIVDDNFYFIQYQLQVIKSIHLPKGQQLITHTANIALNHQQQYFPPHYQERIKRIFFQSAINSFILFYRVSKQEMPQPSAIGFTITKQTLSFLLHQLQAVRTVVSSRLAYEQQRDEQAVLWLQQVKAEIQQRVYLMEKKLEFTLGNSSEAQFEDFVTQFYQQEISKVRQQLSTAKDQMALMQKALKQQQFEQQQPHTMCFNESFSKTSHKPQYPTSSQPSDLLLLQQRQQSIKLKKQLSHCRSLIQQNQQFINEQNTLIKQLSQQVIQHQQRECQLRTSGDNLTINYSNTMKQRTQTFKSMQKQFLQHRKLYQKQLKQLEITNSYLYQQKQALQAEIITKSDEVTVLAKRVYQLELTINKYQRELDNKATINIQSDQAMLLLNDQVNIWKKKCYQVESVLRERGRAVDEEKSVMEGERRQCVKQVQELRHKIATYYQPNQLAFQRKLSHAQSTITTLRSQLTRLQSQLHSQQLLLAQKQKLSKQLQKQLTTKTLQHQSLSQHIKQLQQQLNKQQKRSSSIMGRQNEQKSKMKREIYNQVQELLRINNQAVKRIKVQEMRIKELTQEVQARQEKVQAVQVMLGKLQALNEQLLKRNNSYMVELQQHKDIICQLQAKLKSSTLSQTQIDKSRHQLTQRQKQINQQQRLIKQQQKLLKSLQKQLKHSHQQLQQEISAKQQLQRELDAVRQVIHRQHSQTQNQQSFTQQIALLKQEHCKKDFLIKQLQSKIALLQQQLRETEEVTELERNRMKLKIKQLQQLLKERYDFSNRPSNEG